jgi:hypothetical protein
MALYNCRETFTDVMSALQIGPLCSNKPNFRKSQMNVTKVLTKNYDKMDTWSIRKNKPNSNPIQSQFKPNQSQNKPNTNPKQTQFHMIMLLRMKINTRPNPLGPCTDDIEHDCPGHRIPNQRPKKCRITDEIEMNNRKNQILIFFATILVLGWVFAPSGNLHANRKPSDTNPRQKGLKGWKTNTAKRTIELNELISGGPGKDGIPAINKPKFVKPSMAEKWLKSVEPVISLVVNDKTKAYPLQILMWHEIVNDRIGGVPVTVSFCPLCYSANVFDRRVKAKVYTFGVSGMLRYSDMVMYDRQTQSLWQQFTGQAIVGDMVGTSLKRIPAQIISFEQFKTTYKTGLVLSRDTGHRRNYGRNPYVGYDDIDNKPHLYRGKEDPRLKPMAKLITVNINNISKAYPYSITRKKRVINDEVGGQKIVIFHDRGAASALDKAEIAQSREDGSTGVFHRKLAGQLLTFSKKGETFMDDQTSSIWDITGRAIQGELKGKKLSPVVHGDYFAFAWLVFKPETKIYTE